MLDCIVMQMRKVNSEKGYCHIITSHMVAIILVWGSFELNSQMAPSLSQDRVLSTLTMSSFELEV